MSPEGYAILLESNGQIILRFYPDCNNDSVWIEVIRSYNYDAIMRALMSDRTNRGQPKEYWIS